MALVTQHVKNTSKEDIGNAVLAIEGTPESSNKTEHFSYKGEMANA